VIVSFNTRHHLCSCIASALREGASVIVVADNGSDDGSVETIRRLFPSVVVDLDASNPGYGAAANRAIRRCAGDVLLLNGDTCLRPGALEALSQYLADHPGAGIVGPRLLSPDGTLQRSCFSFPTPLRPPLQTDPIAWLTGRIPGLRERSLASWSHDCARVVPWVTGAALAIRRQAFDDLGGFDESFVLYAEEIDLCYRARQRGWETHFVPAAEIEHVGGSSTRQRRAAMLAQGCRSAMHFYRRHYAGHALAGAACTMAGAMAGRVVRDCLRRAMTTDPVRRAQLTEDLAVWRSALVHAMRTGFQAPIERIR